MSNLPALNCTCRAEHWEWHKEGCPMYAQEQSKRQGLLASNEQGPLWTPTVTVERLLRHARLSTADQITMERKQLEGLLFDVLRCRSEHLIPSTASETGALPDDRGLPTPTRYPPMPKCAQPATETGALPDDRGLPTPTRYPPMPKCAQPATETKAEYESVGWQYKFPSIWGGCVWRDSASRYNGHDYSESREIFAKRSPEKSEPRHMNQEERDAMNRAFEKSITVIDDGQPSSPPDASRTPESPSSNGSSGGDDPYSDLPVELNP